jgi:hypothetical protein
MSTQQDNTNEQPRRSRRGFLRLFFAGGLGLAGGGALAAARDATAADSGNLVIGQDNDATGQTKLSNSGALADDAAFRVDAPQADYGISASGKSIGLYGQGPIGVYGDGAVGGVFSGSDASLSLTPRGTSGAPGGTNMKGDVALDADGVLWLCVAGGSPGTWIKISHGGTRMLASPQRVYDSRDNGGPPFSPGTQRTVDVVATNKGVPAQALGIVCNLTVTQTSSFGFLTAWPDGSRPNTSNVNWSSAGTTIAGAATVGLGAGGKINLYVEACTAHVIVDVAGYVL